MSLAENIGRKKSPKIRHLRTIGQLFPDLSWQLKARIDNRKNTCWTALSPHMCSQWWTSSTRGWDRFVSFGAPQRIWTGFASWLRYCTAL